ncbi:MAG: hypothetical protein GVY07_00125, partial [Bacteroidetes bacterium]|nr:hypothetical protein [Bacteroidota bacterium]
EGLDAEAISKTEQFWQKGFDLIGDSRQLEQQIEKLEREQKETPKSNVLISGISELSKWLSAYGSPAKPISKVYLGLVFIAVLGTAVAVQFIGSVGYIGVAVVAIILYLIYTEQMGGSDSSVSLREADFEKTGLKAPSTWKPDEVSQRLEELIQALEEAKRQEDLNKKLLEKKGQLTEANDELEAFEEEVDKLKENIKVLPDFNSENLKDYSSLYWHIKYVLDWDSARNRINAEESVIEKAKEDIQAWLDKINPIFEKYGLSTVSNYADAKAGHKRLQELREQFNELSGKIEKAESEQKRAREDKEKAEANIQTICKRLEVSPEDSFQLKELVDDLESFHNLKQEKNRAEGLLEDIQKTMENDKLYEKEKEEIAEVSIDDVESRIEVYEKESEKLVALQKQITEIETRVKDTKQKHDLEEALQKEEEALLDLEELYKENAGSIIGDLLVKHLKGDLGEKNMPEVFDRAKDLFKRITKNRYELVVDSVNDTAEFRAKDMRYGGVGRSLEELSTGTRIQLIMSVRLSFIEQAEDEIKLPVLADELLANSDSQRAGAIIDALIEISKEGRQIFYFTAQEDEVGKWMQKLNKESKIDYQIYSIEQNLDKLNLERVAFDGIQLYKEIPEPESLSYDEYGKVLEVPPLANVFNPVDQLHIWYLLDDPDLLYKMMKQGIENWGMLKSYFNEEGVIKGLDENARNKIEQRAKIIKRYLELLRHGQNKPIDRQILEESDAVSENRLDEVSELLSKKNGDPEKLIQGLYDSEVKRYFNSKTKELEDYFIANGYIQQNEPFSRDEVKTKMRAFISTKDITKEQAQIFLDRISSRL